MAKCHFQVRTVKILAIEPYFKGSHKTWLEELAQNSSHQIKQLTLPGVHWKWRMHGASLALAEQADEFKDFVPDLILFTDMMDVNLFLSLTRKKFSKIKTALYFHENQFAYPISKFDRDPDQRNAQYGFINLTSAMAVDHIFFNSEFNRNSFLEGSNKLLQKMPDCKNSDWVKNLELKSSVLRLGLNIEQIEPQYNNNKVRTILWNHRWEFDKNPTEFFKALKIIKEKNIPFRLNLIGRRSLKAPEIFVQAMEDFKEEIINGKEVSSYSEYLKILRESDIIPVTSHQEYFGISTVEAICSGIVPLLPNRLAYPELVPSELHSGFLYQTFEEYLEKLEGLLTKDLPSINHLINHCQQYDWSKMIVKYDQKLLELI